MHSPKKKLARKERSSFSLSNWNLAFDIVMCLIIKERPDWTPGFELSEQDRSKISKAVNERYREHGASLVHREVWHQMVGSTLNPDIRADRDGKILSRFRRLTGKAA